MASILFKCTQRLDEYSPAAFCGRYDRLADAKEILSEDKRNAVIFQFACKCNNAAFPAMILSRQGGGEVVLGIVKTAVEIATLVGSVAVSLLPAPGSRVRVICNPLIIV